MLKKVWVFDTKLARYRVFNKTQCHFGYRHSVFKKNPHWFVISAVFFKQKKGVSVQLSQSALLERAKKQPKGFTCGSFFKNPPNDYAGRLIEAVDLKGKTVGGAMISDLHANFFINKNGATWQDILSLRDMAKVAILKEFNVSLEEEVKIITV